MSGGTFINTLLLLSEHFSNQLHQSEVATMNKSRQQVFLNKFVPAFQKAHRHKVWAQPRGQGSSIQMPAAYSARLGQAEGRWVFW